jgi:hypothetical protein
MDSSLTDTRHKRLFTKSESQRFGVTQKTRHAIVWWLPHRSPARPPHFRDKRIGDSSENTFSTFWSLPSHKESQIMIFRLSSFDLELYRVGPLFSRIVFRRGLFSNKYILVQLIIMFSLLGFPRKCEFLRVSFFLSRGSSSPLHQCLFGSDKIKYVGTKIFFHTQKIENQNPNNNYNVTKQILVKWH